MRKYPLAMAIAIALLFISPVVGAPSHENINDAFEDPEVLYSYFIENLDRISGTLNFLSDENYIEAEIKLYDLSAALQMPRKIMLELNTMQLGEQLLPEYYQPFHDLHEELSVMHEVQPELSDLLNELTTTEDSGEIGAQLFDCKNLLLRLDSTLENISTLLPALESLDYDTTGILAAIWRMNGTLEGYQAQIEELESDIGFLGKGLFIMVSKTDSIENYRLEVTGYFVYENLPVEMHDIDLHINDEIISLRTGDGGKFGHIYDLPINIDYNRLLIYATTSYNGEAYQSNEVKVGIEIPTILSLTRRYEYSDGIATVEVSGDLRDLYGHGLGNRDIVLQVNGQSIDMVTESDGGFEHVFQDDINDKMSYKIYSEFFPSGSVPYLYSRSQSLQFTIHATTGNGDIIGALKEHFFVMFFLAIAVISVLSLLFFYRPRKRRLSAIQKEEVKGYTVDEVKNEDGKDVTLFKELGILERIGNVKESIIMGYSRMIDFLSDRKVIHPNPSTTHMDVHKDLKRLPGSKEDANIVTYTFELARYSNRRIDKGRKMNFFQSLRSIVDRIGGGG